MTWLLPLIGCGLVLLLFAAALSGPSTSKAQARRLQAVRERHSNSGEVQAEAKFRSIVASRSTESQFGTTLHQLIPNRAQLQLRLERTGRDWSLGRYASISLGLTLVPALLLLMSGAPFLLALFVGTFLGIGLPHMVVGMLIKKRGAQFNERFPDAIELMVRGLRSGLPVSETMQIVAGELDGPVAVEFRAVSDRMRIGRTMEAALQETADRLGTPEFQFFVIALAIQRETGGNLAETLANLADVLRRRISMKLKIKAMSSEAKASAMILGALPFLVFGLIYMVNAEYVSEFFSEPRLMVAGGGALTWLALGAFIMSRMVSFEI